jgi:16S rRNA (guanine527-N7)-methyltransferase
MEGQGVGLITSYFPGLTTKQVDRFQALEQLYVHWNEQINVISRKDTDNFYERHVLHSLGIAKVCDFLPGSKVLDIGTGGGFPGIPLAIMFPETEFTLVDSIGKKIHVVQEVVQALGLSNVTAIHGRAENVSGQFDFVVSRAVTAMPAFLKWTKGKIKPTSLHPLKNGILYLKGGDLTEEFSTVKVPYNFTPLTDFFTPSFFDTKQVVHVISR